MGYTVWSDKPAPPGDKYYVPSAAAATGAPGAATRGAVPNNFDANGNFTGTQLPPHPDSPERVQARAEEAARLFGGTPSGYIGTGRGGQTLKQIGQSPAAYIAKQRDAEVKNYQTGLNNLSKEKMAKDAVVERYYATNQNNLTKMQDAVVRSIINKRTHDVDLNPDEQDLYNRVVAIGRGQPVPIPSKKSDRLPTDGAAPMAPAAATTMAPKGAAAAPRPNLDTYTGSKPPYDLPEGRRWQHTNEPDFTKWKWRPAPAQGATGP
jgi:hypothetical protein